MTGFYEVFLVVIILVIVGYLTLSGKRIGSSKSGKSMISLMEEQIEVARQQVEETRRQNEIHLRIAEALERKDGQNIRHDG